MANDQQADMQRLQILEQSLHTHGAQRNAYQSQLLEIENASSELANAKESYRIIGNVMVKSDPEKLKAGLDEKKATLQSRLASLEKQEKRLREEMDALQKSILGDK